MASLVLGIAGTAIGSAIGGSVSVLGATLSAAQIGGFIGATIGQQIDGALFSSSKTAHQEGPRLSDLNLTASTEGAPIPRLYGRVRLGGQLIWASQFKETVTNTTQTTGGGKGFGGGGGTKVQSTSYSYSISFAVGLCEGKVTRLGRVWADGKPLDLSKYVTRFYKGDEAQAPDPLLEVIEGAGNMPAYRGLSYVVFEDLPLAEFGNRIPQLQFEVIRALNASDPQALDNVVRGVCLVPGSGEFVLATDIVKAEDGFGGTSGQNKNNNLGLSDLEASVDQLQALLPNCRSVILVVAWFGDDLRCGACRIRPKVEIASKETSPWSWSVNGIGRATAEVVSADGEGRPVFGGTPADQAVTQAIGLLKARGFAVHFYPFVLMDIPAGNGKPDPYGASEQAAFPWRGRITCEAGSDKTASAASQVNTFFESEWGYRRMVLHYAQLCAGAGGVDGFLLGSELEALTEIRSSASAYPAVTQLVALAADVKAVLPAAKISYAANWTEAQGHRPEDGSGDVYFHLDPLWASSDIDFVGVDSYPPLSDWRDGETHLDFAPGRRITDRDYLDGNVEGGEFFDWFYASEADRGAQLRTPIADPLGEPWVFRFKDLKGWWSQAHYNRPGGVKDTAPTGWVPEMKPVWLTELGCPAVDRGSNEPNVFVDPKSSESALPHYSRGFRDDLIQRRALEAAIGHWTDPAHNPGMIDTARIHVWCWDARSFPDFPSRASVWTDAPNWRLGHWLNGRVGLVALADLVTDLCAYAGFDQIDASGLFGLVTGFLIDRTMSVREALDPLMLVYQFDAFESEGLIKFAHRGGAPRLSLAEDDLVLANAREPKAGFSLARAQETDLPLASRLSYIDAAADYRQSAIESRRLTGRSDRVAVSTVPIVMEQGFAQGVSDMLLMDAWERRERCAFALPPSKLALDVSDILTLQAGGRDWRLRLTEIADGPSRKIAAERTDPSLYDIVSGPEPAHEPQAVPSFGKPLGIFLDLPILSAASAAHAPYFASYAAPWPGAVMLYRAAGSSGFSLDAVSSVPSRIGTSGSDFYSGPLWRFDRVNDLYVTLIAGTLESRSDIEVLNGANALALENADGEWEILQYTTAELIAPRAYKLSGLLRGLGGTEGAMRNPVAAGARAVILDGALVQPGFSFDQRSLTFTYRYGPAGEAFSDPAYVQETRGFAGVGLRPFAPAGLRGRRDAASGDWTLSWIRRTRIGGDDWSQTEVPLGETAEGYDVEIYDVPGAALKRAVSVTGPSLAYSAAQQIADFGAPQWNFTARVYQTSDAFGRGPAAEALIWHY
jgi:GTA TIM-barrel-like domain/Putative phage tail protein